MTSTLSVIDNSFAVYEYFCSIFVYFISLLTTTAGDIEAKLGTTFATLKAKSHRTQVVAGKFFSSDMSVLCQIDKCLFSCLSCLYLIVLCSYFRHELSDQC